MLNRKDKITPPPDPKALFYRRTREDGRKEVAAVSYTHLTLPTNREV